MIMTMNMIKMMTITIMITIMMTPPYNDHPNQDAKSSFSFSSPSPSAQPTPTLLQNNNKEGRGGSLGKNSHFFLFFLGGRVPNVDKENLSSKFPLSKHLFGQSAILLSSTYLAHLLKTFLELQYPFLLRRLLAL